MSTQDIQLTSKVSAQTKADGYGVSKLFYLNGLLGLALLVAMGWSAYTAGRWNHAVDVATLKALAAPVRERAAQMPARGCDDCLFVATSLRPNFVTYGDVTVAERVIEIAIEDDRQANYEAKRRQEQAEALNGSAVTK